MQKLVKRTLAFMLVVSLLCGMLVMTASAAGATPESDGSYYYDFTMPGRLEWVSGTSQFTSFGNKYLIGPNSLTANQRPQYESYYNTGKNTYKVEDVEYTFEHYLSFDAVAMSSDTGLIIVGGNKYNDANSHMGYDGISITPREEGVTTGIPGWGALKIKAPDVGSYNVTLDYTKGKQGAKEAYVYIVPGVVTDRTEIARIITMGIGKLDQAIDFYASDWTGDQTLELGNVFCDAACEEYTVIFRSVKSSSGGSTGEARMYVDGLRLTSAEKENQPVVYNFNKTSAGLSISGTLTGSAATLDQKYTDGVLNWDYLGGTIASGNDTISSDHLYLKNFGSTATITDGKRTGNLYVAFKIKSPGEGVYSFDLKAKNAAVGTINERADKHAHMWMDAYLYKLGETDSETNFLTYRESAELAGSYEPEFVVNAAASWQTSHLLTYDFDAGAEYILYLERSPDADVSSSADASTYTCAIFENYSPNHAYLESITATYVPQNVAVVGEDYIAETAFYNLDLWKQNATDYPSYTGSANAEWTITALDSAEVKAKLDTWYNAETDALNWDYIGTTCAGTDFYAPRVVKANANNGYLHFTTAGIANINDITDGKHTNNYYVALKLKSPGDGEFALDLKTYVMALASSSTAYTKTTHLWLDAYLVELKEGMTEENYREYLTDSLTAAGSYQPDYLPRASYVTDEDKTDYTKVFISDDLLTATFEKNKEYILYLRRSPDADVYASASNVEEGATEYAANTTDHYSANNIYLQSITATPTRENYVAPKYLTVNEALDAAAETGETVKLLRDALETTIDIPKGVTLDLNGYTLTTSNLTTVDGGKLIDSVGTGLLNVLADRVSFGSQEAWAENTLPLYDAANNGYRFFQYELESDPLTESTGENAQKFWFRFVFVGDKKDEAYALVETRNSGLTLRAKIEHDQGENILPFVNTKGENAVTNDADGFAAAYASFAKGATNPWLYVNVTSTNLSEKLDITPVISVGGEEITGEAISKQ